MSRDLPETAAYSTLSVAIAAIVGIGTALLSVWAANGFATNFEELFRVAPTADGGGVGSDWIAGNTITSLDFLIAITHAADVLLGAFILVMVFIHWGAFRRLASRMRRPGERRRQGVTTDGGTTDETANDRTATDGGTAADVDAGGHGGDAG
jgi:amino acid transporter